MAQPASPVSLGAIPAAEAGQVVDGTPVSSPSGEHAVASGRAETSTTQPAVSGGLPQFKFEYWGGQIVWLVVLFAVLYALLARVFIPRLGLEIPGEEIVAVQLDPAVDKGRNPAKCQITAETLAVEDGAAEPHNHGSVERRCRRHRISRPRDRSHHQG